MAHPTDAHFHLVKCIFRYLQCTIDCGLTYSSMQTLDLIGFSHADWASDFNTRRSTTSYVVFLGHNPISWQAKKQSSVSQSSTKAEYKALANADTDIA